MADGGQHQQDQQTDVAAPTTEQPVKKSAGRMSNALLDLQRVAGNASTTAFVQTKLVVGKAADPAESEADEIADAVLERLRQPSGGDDGDEGGANDGSSTVRRS